MNYELSDLRAKVDAGFGLNERQAIFAFERLDELLAACEALLAEHDRCFEGREHMRNQYYAAHPFREIAYNKARAAIAKAKGES